MAPLTYIDCLNCQGRGYHFVTGYTSRYDNRAPTEPCTYCSGRGWVNIMQKDEECSTCGGYGWGKVGEHAVALLKVWRNVKIVQHATELDENNHKREQWKRI